LSFSGAARGELRVRHLQAPAQTADTGILAAAAKSAVAVRRSPLARWLSVLSHVASSSVHPSSLLAPLRAGYFGPTTFGRRNQPRTVFLDSPVRLATSRKDIASRKCIRLILANIATLITPRSPALLLSGQANHGGSVLLENYLPKWVSSGWTSTKGIQAARCWITREQFDS
jgi:hypothetical protein